jgi:hypothetical protein
VFEVSVSRKNVYNEECSNIGSDKFKYSLRQTPFPFSTPKLKEKFGIVYNYIKIFKCCLLKEYEYGSVIAYVRIRESDNITTDNIAKGSPMWLFSLIGWSK